MPYSTGGSEAIPTTYAEIEQLLFDPFCAQQCHKGGAAPKGLPMEPGRALRALVGQPAVEVPGMLRVAPGQPSASYLIVKVVPHDRRRVGTRMPRNGPPFLTSAQVGAMKRWIRAGAQDDWVDDTSTPVADAGEAAPDASSDVANAGPDPGPAVTEDPP